MAISTNYRIKVFKKQPLLSPMLVVWGDEISSSVFSNSGF